MEGMLEPRSRREIVSTVTPTFSASSACVSRLERRKLATRLPSIFSTAAPIAPRTSSNGVQPDQICRVVSRMHFVVSCSISRRITSIGATVVRYASSDTRVERAVPRVIGQLVAGLGGLVLVCMWTAVAAAAPVPMLLLSAALIVGVLVGLLVPRLRGVVTAAFRPVGWIPVALPAAVGLGAGALGIVVAIAVLRAPETAHRPSRSAQALGSSDQPEPAGGELARADAGAGVVDVPDEPIRPRPPSARDLELDAEVSAELERDASREPIAAVARRRSLPREVIDEAVARVAEHRGRLEAELSRVAGTGIVGDVSREVTVTRTDLGPFTAHVSLTVVGCPSGRLPDERLDFLARTALTQLVRNMPPSIDGFRASLWYEGIACSRASMGYSAEWSRRTGRLRLH